MAHLVPDLHDAGEYQLARLLSDPDNASHADATVNLDALIEASRDAKRNVEKAR